MQDAALWKNYAFLARYGRQPMSDMVEMPYPDFCALLVAVVDHVQAESGSASLRPDGD